jgi:hypothetical protein
MPRPRDEDDEFEDRPRKKRPREDDEEVEDRPSKKRSRRVDDDEEVAKPGNMVAVVGLILSILSFCGLAIFGIPAMICGGLGMKKAATIGGAGKGMAVTAMLIGGFTSFVLTPAAGYGVYYVVSKGKAAIGGAATRQQISNDGKQIGIAMHNVHDTMSRMPAPFVTSGLGVQPTSGNPNLSWRVELLPYVEQGSLYTQFQLSQPWDSSSNRRFADQRVMPYASRYDLASPNTHFRVFVGSPTTPPQMQPIFSSDLRSRRGMSRIMDGTSNTIMVIETEDSVRWTEPKEIPYDGKSPLPKFGHAKNDNFLVVMADGSVKWIRKTVSESTLRAAITAEGGEVVFLE